MNILSSKLPDCIFVDKKQYEINTDFRVWIEIENTFLDNSIKNVDKLVKMLRLCYKTLPKTIDDALQGMMIFYSLGNYKKTKDLRQENQENQENQEKKVSQIFSFLYDDIYIYSAFYKDYGIDLQKAHLHWWQFMALFKGLDKSNEICKIMEYRAVNLEDIKSKEQKVFYRKMKKLYALPETRTEEEIEYEMIKSLEKIF